MAASIWNSADQVNVTLSNNSLSTICTGSSGGVRATQGQTTGKYYFEYVFDQTSSNLSGVGIANASAALGSIYNFAPNAALVYPNGNVYMNGGFQFASSLPGSTYGASGSSVCVAVDVGAKLIWFRWGPIGAGAAGAWNGSGANNPATGTGGVSFSAIAGASIFPVAAYAANGDRHTANFGVTPFLGAVPAGFTAGWPTSTTQTTNFTQWNASDKSASTTLLGGNLTTSWDTTAGGVRSVARFASGKYYFEFHAVRLFGAATGFGIANASANLSTVSTTIPNAAVIYKPGSIWVNAVNSGAFGVSVAINDGDVISCALDLVNNQIWFRSAPSGTWNNSGTANPATNTGGVGIGAIASGGVYAFVATNAASSGETIQADFGDTPFVGAVPSGFTSGFPVAALSSQSRIMVMA